MKPDAKEHWYVAFTRSCQERMAADMLSRLGVRSFVALQRVKRKWSDRIKIMDQVVLPHIIFVRCTDAERISLIAQVPYMTRYMSAGKGTYDPAIVPDAEMEAFMMMLSQSDVPVTVEQRSLSPGQTVKVVRGPMTGMVAQITTINSRTHAYIKLSMLGVAAVEISLEDIVPVEPVSDQKQVYLQTNQK